jgi:hypothetical protein
MHQRNISLVSLVVCLCVIAACRSESPPESAAGTGSTAPATSSPSPAPAVAVPAAGPHQVNGFVYEDRNRNGQFDAGDERLPQQVVLLTDTDNFREIRSVTTGADGVFRLENVPDGAYRVTLRIPEGFERTVDDSFVITVSPERTIPEVQFGVAAR